MNQDNKGTFFDKKTILAVALTGLVFFGWNKYISMKYPNYGQAAKKTEADTRIETSTGPTTEAAAGTVAQKPAAGELKAPLAAPIPEKTLRIETSETSLEISSLGMGLKSVVLNQYKARDGQKIQLGNVPGESLFAMKVANQFVPFELSQADESGRMVIVGKAKLGNMEIERKIHFTGPYSLSSQTQIRNAPSDFKEFEVTVPEKHFEGEAGSIFAPATDFQEVVVRHSDKTERTNLTTTTEDVIKSLGIQSQFGISSHYFAMGYLEKSDLLPEVLVDAKKTGSQVLVRGIYKISSVQPEIRFESSAYFGPKDLKAMESLSETSGADFSNYLNFGFFGPIGKLLLKILQFFHHYAIPNWGVAIILLTLLVRLIVLPFNVMSFKSMKKMQTIQPQLQAMRERYKEDPTRLNSETMKLMKDQKVNPLGGCLPMLLQMPVFFALYQVLGQSIELYQAPFFGWIQDLSLKDPLFVTPVLMGVAMWYNQKITPSTMDPTQAKVMQFLPLLFSFMMISLPSGLTLYIFVSTLFGIIQQQMFMKDRSTHKAAAV